MSTGRVQVLFVADEHAAALAAFFRRFWDPASTEESVRAGWSRAASANLSEPGEVPPAVVVMLEASVIGYVGTLPVRFWDGTEIHRGYWIKGLMVAEEHRNGPVGMLLLKTLRDRTPLAGAMVVAEPARRLFEALGFQSVGLLSNYVRLLRGDRVAEKLNSEAVEVHWPGAALLPILQRSGVGRAAGHAFSLANSAWAMVNRLPYVASRLRSGSWVMNSAEADALWAGCRGHSAAAVRDGAYLEERYGDARQYQALEVRRSGRLTGLAFLRVPRVQSDSRLRGLTVASLSDIVVSAADLGSALTLFRATDRAARSLGSDAIVFTGGSMLRPALLRHGYFPIGGNVHFLFRDNRSSAGTFPNKLSDWYLTRGDAHSDEVF